MTQTSRPPVAQRHPLSTVLALLRADAPAEIVRTPQDWPRWAALLPHVLAVVTHVDDTDDTTVAADVSWLLDRAGTYLSTQGRPAKPARWPNARWPSPKMSTAPTTPTSPSR